MCKYKRNFIKVYDEKNGSVKHNLIFFTKTVIREYNLYFFYYYIHNQKDKINKMQNPSMFSLSGLEGWLGEE